MASSIESDLGLSFRDKDLLHLARVHGSYVNESAGETEESNERLEFLGDALLDLVVAQELYQRHPLWPEGRLTASRAEIVQGGALARVAERLHLGEHLILGRGEEESGGRRRPSNLAAAFEAVLGAVFLDQGYEAARGFVARVLSTELSDTAQRAGVGSPKSTLQELAQGKGLPAPTYRIVDASGRDHARQFTAEVLVDGRVAGRGSGPRKALAEREAAARALEALGCGH